MHKIGLAKSSVDTVRRTKKPSVKYYVTATNAKRQKVTGDSMS